MIPFKSHLERLIKEDFPSEVDEYYVMPRVRFHSSLDRDQLLGLTKNVLKEMKPDVVLNWKNTDTVIFIEVLKRNCYLTILRDWTGRQKYNWQEYHKRQTKSQNKDMKKVEVGITEVPTSESQKPDVKISESVKSAKESSAAVPSDNSKESDPGPVLRKFEEPEILKSDLE